MKCFLWLSVLSLVISTSACSKKESVPPQQPVQTDAAPESKYGKAMKAAEDVVSQSEKKSDEFDETDAKRGLRHECNEVAISSYVPAASISSAI